MIQHHSNLSNRLKQCDYFSSFIYLLNFVCSLLLKNYRVLFSTIFHKICMDFSIFTTLYYSLLNIWINFFFILFIKYYYLQTDRQLLFNKLSKNWESWRKERVLHTYSMSRTLKIWIQHRNIVFKFSNSNSKNRYSIHILLLSVKVNFE